MKASPLAAWPLLLGGRVPRASRPQKAAVCLCGLVSKATLCDLGHIEGSCVCVYYLRAPSSGLLCGVHGQSLYHFSS
jgi:hypothetical protein